MRNIISGCHNLGCFVTPWTPLLQLFFFPLLVSWFAVVLWTGCGTVLRQGTSIIVPKCLHLTAPHATPTEASDAAGGPRGCASLACQECTKLWGALSFTSAPKLFYFSDFSLTGFNFTSVRMCVGFCFLFLTTFFF
uniref:Uncharacterized protein n=1 Tax=Pyxicephalus adspersus TaxID=30357 RepID=A0AAV3AJU6_PYXAD|nr:TPA: hypothetical protein GDO54_008103 [Pyxicephalus adspersus]